MASRAGKVSATTLPFLLRALRNTTPPLPIPHKRPLPSLRRAFSLYDQINVLSGVPEDRIRIEGCTDAGFLANGVQYEGSLICISNLIVSWSPKQFSEVTPDSLSIFQLLRPAPEILVLGCGKQTKLIDPSIKNFLRTNHIKVEAVDSWHAASTFNFLNEEGRMVAGAFLPPGVSS
uniref:NADH dehydrogenase [ubiquinone] 1 alpha subcomplex assembly factor 3 n=1 Tax=Wollemia nobilis TaxID=56998 RepID=A0A0C9S806_9CONI